MNTFEREVLVFCCALVGFCLIWAAIYLLCFKVLDPLVASARELTQRDRILLRLKLRIFFGTGEADRALDQTDILKLKQILLSVQDLPEAAFLLKRGEEAFTAHHPLPALTVHTTEFYRIESAINEVVAEYDLHIASHIQPRQYR